MASQRISKSFLNIELSVAKIRSDTHNFYLMLIILVTVLALPLTK